MASNKFLNVSVHHAVGIKPIKLHIGPMSPYTTVGIVGHKYHPKPQKTNPHIHGDTDPLWESQMVVELPQDAFNEGSLYNFVAEIKHYSHVSDRVIGKVTIPLRDVFVNRERVGYLVMTKGEAHGKLILSHSLVDDDDDADVAVAAGTHASSIPLPPTEATLVVPAPTANPLVAIGLVAGATTIGDNLVNTVTNLTDLFGN
uniref:uncharacterized protein LOC122586315 n=1 Tax=Erigeron canadensis TaxID=72917 RepID=UPI001CB93237|nr:uncharacterized protein LOC122586315 [Erigeron canadensis]